MKILCVGDIVGSPGCEMVYSQLKYIASEYDINFVIANGENAATGNGITAEKAEKLYECGVDVITLGNHGFTKAEAGQLMNDGFPICNKNIAVINALGRVFLNPIDSPFDAVMRCVEEIKDIADIIIVDFHAEATSEKAAMAWYLDGKVTAVYGTHTHVQTADERLLPCGTAFITDIGMTGPYNSVLGVDKDASVSRFLTLMNKRYKVADGNCVLYGIIIDIDDSSNKAVSIRRLKIF